MKSSKGQTSFEYMSIVALVLVILLPLSIFLFNQADASTRSKQAEVAANTLASAADVIYAQGKGSKTTVQVFLPVGYSAGDSSFTGKTISIKYYLGKSLIEASAQPRANVTGTFSTGAGYRTFTLEMLDNVVNITAK